MLIKGAGHNMVMNKPLAKRAMLENAAPKPKLPGIRECIKRIEELPEHEILRAVHTRMVRKELERFAKFERNPDTVQ
jgi:hypothetical protein